MCIMSSPMRASTVGTTVRTKVDFIGCSKQKEAHEFLFVLIYFFLNDTGPCPGLKVDFIGLTQD